MDSCQYELTALYQMMGQFFATKIYMIFGLLVAYQLKHFLADYPLQGVYMLKKFLGGWSWVLPLAAHAGVHGLFTLLICLAVNPAVWWLSLFDFAAHFTMDRIKASPNLLGRFKSISHQDYKEYRQALGLCNNDDERKSVEKSYKIAFKHNSYFWWSLGFDQMVHHLTHYVIIFFLVFG